MALRIHVWAPTMATNGGGVAAFSRELARSLVAAGHEVEVFAKTERPRRRAVRWVSGISHFLSAVRFACRVVGAAARRTPTLIVAAHLNFGPIARFSRTLFRCRYVLVAHGIDVDPGLSPQRARALRLADGVWAVSRWTRDRLLALSVGDDRISIIGNTVDDERFTPGCPPDELRGRYGIPEQARLILTVARLSASEAYKGYDSVVRVLAGVRHQLGDVRYLLVGSGDDRGRVEELAANCGVGEYVAFAGFVADEELPGHFRAADIFVMPSSGEGFGIVYLEAMACGLPVVGGRKDGTVDALADGDLGTLIDPEVDEELADAIIRQLSGAEGRSALDRETTRARMLERHGRSRFDEKVARSIRLIQGS